MAIIKDSAVEVPAHGGVLVDRLLRDAELADAHDRARSLTRIALNARTMSDVELLASGAYSPLEGFMGEADYRGVLHNMRLANGLPRFHGAPHRRGAARAFGRRVGRGGRA